MKTQTKILNCVLTSTLVAGTIVAMDYSNSIDRKNEILPYVTNKSSYTIKDMESDKNINAAIITTSDNNDHLYTWGKNYHNALGYETNNINSLVPREVKLPKGEMEQIVLGRNDTNLLVHDNDESMGVVIKNPDTKLNELWMWGSNTYGKLGLENVNYFNGTTSPHKVLGDSKTNVDKVVQSSQNTAVLYEEVDENGVISNNKNLGLFGTNMYGEMANGEGRSTGWDGEEHPDMVVHKNIKDGVTFDNIWAGVDTFYVQAYNESSKTMELYSWGNNGPSGTMLGIGTDYAMYSSSFEYIGSLNAPANQEKIIDLESNGVGTVELIKDSSLNAYFVYSWGVSYNGSIGYPGTGEYNFIDTPDVVKYEPEMVAYEYTAKTGIEYSKVHLIGQEGLVLEGYNNLLGRNVIKFSGMADEYNLNSPTKFQMYKIPEVLSNKKSKIVYGSKGTNVDPYAYDENNKLYIFDTDKKEFKPVFSIN